MAPIELGSFLVSLLEDFLIVGLLLVIAAIAGHVSSLLSRLLVS